MSYIYTKLIMNYNLLFIVFYFTSSHFVYGGNKKDISETVGTVKDVVETAQMSSDMYKEWKDKQSKKKKPKRSSDVNKEDVLIKIADNVLDVFDIDPIHYQNIPWFDFNASFVDLLNFEFKLLDIVACNMTNNITRINFTHYGIIINNTSPGEVYELLVDHNSFHASQIELWEIAGSEPGGFVGQATYKTPTGKFDISTIEKFYNRYSNYGCRVLINPYPRLTDKIEDESVYLKFDKVYAKWYDFAVKRISNFKNTVYYTKEDCNCQNTALYLVYGYYDAKPCKLYVKESQLAITTKRQIVDILYDYCYMYNIMKGNNVQYGTNCKNLSIFDANGEIIKNIRNIKSTKSEINEFDISS